MAARHGGSRALRQRMGRAPLTVVCIGLLGLGACGGSTDSSGDGAPGTGSDVVTAPAATDVTPATEPTGTDPDATDPAPATDAPPTTDDPAPTEPTATTPPPAPPADPLDFDDAMLDSVIEQAAANPLVGLPGRSTLASERLVGELVAAGYDLTGLELTIYPGGSSPAFVVMATDDSSAIADDGSDVDGEAFLLAVLNSPVMTEHDVERLVLQHSSSDDEGPFVLTFTVPLADLRSAVETGSDPYDGIAVQVERP